MDQIKDLLAFHGVILSADNYHSFSKITSKGGNEEKVKYIIEKLSNFLKEKNYIGEDGVVEENVDNYRKLALYLILNADLPALADMTEAEGLEAAVWALPTVPRYLLAELLWALHMAPFAAEAVGAARPALAAQLAAALAHHLRYLDPARHLPRARLLAAACHRLLARLPYAARRDPALPPAARDAFRACLKPFVDPPNAHRLLELSRDRQYRHLGDALALLLELVDECVRRSQGREPFRSGRAADLHLATHAPRDVAAETLDFDVCDGPDEAVRRCLAECHEALFDAAAALVMAVSVDVFCAWSEYEDAGVSMQRAIGELCYRVRRALLAARGLPDHRLPELLKQLARAPLDPAAAAADMDVAELAERARGAGAGPAAWRAALLARADLCRRPALLRPLEAHLAELDEEGCRRLFDAITAALDEEPEDAAHLKALAVKAFHRCGADGKLALARRLFADHLHDELEGAEFEDAATEILNRLAAAGAAGAGAGDGADVSDALTLFIQSPRRALLAVFRAAAGGAPQAALMLGVMERLAPFAAACYARDTEPCVVKVANHALEHFVDSERRLEALVMFLSGLKERGVLPENQLLLQVCTPRLHAALLAGDVAGMDAQLRLLRAALGAGGLRPFRAPALALLAQLLPALRWPPAAFRADTPPARDRALQLLDELMDTYGDEPIPEKESSWLRPRLARLPPLDAAHFRRVRPAPLPPAQHMLQSLCVLSAREWRFPLRAAWRAAGGALLAEPAAALRRRAPAAEPACLHYALGNFVVHIQNEYFSSPPTEEQVVAALRAAAGVAEAALDARPAAAVDWGAALAPLAACLPAAGEREGASEGEGGGARAAAARALRRAAPALAAALSAAPAPAPP